MLAQESLQGSSIHFRLFQQGVVCCSGNDDQTLIGQMLPRFHRAGRDEIVFPNEQ